MGGAADIWILSRARRGDLNQMIDLADAVGAPYEIKTIADAGGPGAPPFASEPPPRLVMSAERLATETALAIKARGGGRTMAVSIGRPGLRIDEFDLVVTAPQFRVRQAPNVLELATPLHRLDRIAMADGARRLQAELEGLPRPYTVALIGGSSAPERLDGPAAGALGDELTKRVRRTGGSLLLITSPRTSDKAARILSETAAGSGRVFLWRPGLTFNPYQGLLELADEFVVTSDSASMPIEAALTGKPTFIHRLPRRLSPAALAVEAAERCRGWLAPIDRLFHSGALESRADRRRLFDPLEKRGVLRTFSADAQDFVPAPLESSAELAAAAVRRLLASAD